VYPVTTVALNWKRAGEHSFSKSTVMAVSNVILKKICETSTAYTSMGASNGIGSAPGLIVPQALAAPTAVMAANQPGVVTGGRVGQ